MEKTITGTTYSILDEAYNYFNKRLWDGKLPACAILLHRHKGAYGYCTKDRVVLKDSKETRDEIALNPDTFMSRDFRAVFGTLVHEMAHHWEFCFGKPSRGGYHNAEWGKEMMRVGLHPSDTGLPGGKTTGQKVSHYIIDGGPFDEACREFLNCHDVSLDWFSFGERPGAAKKRESKTKYQCPECGCNAWAKPETHLVCGDCEREMEVAG